jgi:hypothetical protein
VKDKNKWDFISCIRKFLPTANADVWLAVSRVDSEKKRKVYIYMQAE